MSKFYQIELYWALVCGWYKGYQVFLLKKTKAKQKNKTKQTKNTHLLFLRNWKGMAKLKCNYQKERLIHMLGSYPENAFVKLNF
jgi:hypothetical protein